METGTDIKPTTEVVDTPEAQMTPVDHADHCDMEVEASGVNNTHAQGETNEEEKKQETVFNTFNTKDTYKGTVSTEEGFTGHPDTWFDDDEFKKGLVADFTHKEGADYYFASYSNTHIHEEMLKDKVRTDSYRSAIEGNPEAFRGKVVLDVGCGTGVLSIFAARSGAKHVYGIDAADIVHYAREIVKVNEYEDVITIIQGKVEEVELPVEKVDIIISEWMGYFLLFESMLDSVLFARDKWLTEDGIMLPDRITMHASAIEDSSYKSKKLNFWNSVYGIDMKWLSSAAFVEPIVDWVEYDAWNTTESMFYEIDLYTVTVEGLQFSNEYEIKMMRDDHIHGIVTWFDVFFGNLPHEVNFSTGPYDTRTHWKQTVFYFHGAYELKTGDKIKGSIAWKKSKENFRACDVKISYHICPKINKFEPAESQVVQYKLR